VNEFLATKPYDLYELYLFHLVAKHRSFTKAAELSGLTQSAITRQIQGIEQSLGLALLERTTRSVSLTPAGEFLFSQSLHLIGGVEQSLRTLREEFGGARKVIRLGISRSIGFAYLPGFLHANLRREAAVSVNLSYSSSSRVLSELEAHELDLGVLCPPSRLPRTLRVTHKFQDAFTFIASAAVASSAGKSLSTRKAGEWLRDQNWLLLEESTNTGQQLRAWMTKQGLEVEPIMQLDSFDLIVNLVALGMGVSCVPIRSLALYGQKKSLVRIQYPEKFSRELVVAVRKHRTLPEHLNRFIENVLF
jgi:DNA-binding transcriptional LysR family regulator